MIAGVADHCVPGLQERREAADVGLIAGREDDRVVCAVPLGDLALELGVDVDRAVEQARAGQRRAVAIERIARPGDHPLVAGQPR